MRRGGWARGGRWGGGGWGDGGGWEVGAEVGGGGGGVVVVVVRVWGGRVEDKREFIGRAFWSFYIKINIFN